MKSTVFVCITSFIYSIVVMGLMVLGCVAAYGGEWFMLIAVGLVVLLLVGLFYTPISLKANEKEVEVLSPLKIHSIPMQQIVSCEPFRPTMCKLRIFGLGGFLGFWGIFKEHKLGHYMAYYGNPSQCFMIRLDNGDKYVLGCKKTKAMIDYINSQIHR